MQNYKLSAYVVSPKEHFWRKTGISLTSVNNLPLSLTYIKKNSYLCQLNEDEQYHIEDSDATGAWRGDTLLDVSRRGLAADYARDDGRDGLDVDVAVVPLRHTGTDVPRMALASDAGTSGRTATHSDEHPRHLPVVCCLAAHSPRGRIYALWRADTLRRRVVSQGAGHSGYRACYRLAISDGHHGGRHPAGDEHLRHLLPEDGHQPARHPARFLVDGLPGSSHLRHGHARPAALPAAQTLHI